MKLRWSRSAQQDLEAIADYISARDPNAASRTVQRIIHATRRLEAFPLSARAGSISGTRELALPGLPYLVVYEAGEEFVDVHGVFHTARDPERRG